MIKLSTLIKKPPILFFPKQTSKGFSSLTKPVSTALELYTADESPNSSYAGSLYTTLPHYDQESTKTYYYRKFNSFREHYGKSIAVTT